MLTQKLYYLLANQDCIQNGTLFKSGLNLFLDFLSGIVFETGHYSDRDSIPEYTVVSLEQDFLGLQNHESCFDRIRK